MQRKNGKGWKSSRWSTIVVSAVEVIFIQLNCNEKWPFLGYANEQLLPLFNVILILEGKTIAKRNARPTL